MDSLFVATYPPKRCGIATFTSDLRRAVSKASGEGAARVAAINNSLEKITYPDEVIFDFSRNHPKDYRQAAEFINFSDFDVVSLQHEFGIFGGAEGRYILNLISNLNKPVVTTCHTVLREPSQQYFSSFLEVAKHSYKLVVMSHKAEEILQNVYKVPKEKIAFIHHGVPDVPFIDPNFYKDKFDVEGRMVILTFGLLSPNKGIENMIDALPAVVAKHPEVVYIVLGATHPEVKRLSGEEYRFSLYRRVQALGLEQNVIFHDRFVDLGELCEFIGACDIYVTPYLSREQITSGTLAYAVGMGKAVISTPYWYAEELLDDGRGILVPFRDTRALSDALLEYIENEGYRHQTRKRAYELGRSMIWSEVGNRYLETFEDIVVSYRTRVVRRSGKAIANRRLELPEPRLDHIARLTDDTAIAQHSINGIPDRRFGYSTDDVGRALLVVLQHYQSIRDASDIPMVETYISYLHHAQLDDGRFKNFMSYDRKFLDDVGSEDTFGRALWGLGYAVLAAPVLSYQILAKEMVEKAIGSFRPTSIRGISYTICGLYYYLQKFEGASAVRRCLVSLADSLLEAYAEHSSKGWNWFEDILTYGNAKMPHALMLAYQITKGKQYLETALNALDFLTEQVYNGKFFDLVGNEGWFTKGEVKAEFGQQPIDAGYLVEAYVTAYQLTGDERYSKLAQTAYEWFLGRNRLSTCLYDFNLAACADGLEHVGVNPNQGAESTIAFVLASMALLQSDLITACGPGSSEAKTGHTATPAAIDETQSVEGIA